MRFVHVLTAAALALLAIPASAAALSDRDSGYLKTDIQIQAGRYAMGTYEAQHGSGAAKKYGATVASQAESDTRMLKALAKKYGVTPDDGLLIQDKYHYSQLVGASGSDLNKRFARELGISDNINTYTYKQQMQSSQDGKIKTYAKQRYAALQHEITALKHF